MVLETERLLLKTSWVELAEEWAEFCRRNRAFLTPFEPNREEEYYTAAYHEALLKEEMKQEKERRGVQFYLFRKEEPEKAIGRVGLSNIVWGGFRSCFIGAKMDGDYINQGYMTEATNAVVEYAFHEMGLHRIEANIMPRNRRSLRTAEKCGFRSEGVSEKYLCINGVWEDHVHMVRRNLAMENEV